MAHDPEQEVQYCPGVGCGALIRKLRRREAEPACRICGTPIRIKEVDGGQTWRWEVRELATAQR